jgi:hypothetical protein
MEFLEDRLAPAVLTVNSVADTASPTDPYLSLREAVAIVNSPTLPGGLSDQIRAQIDGVLHEGSSDTIVFDPTTVTGPIVLGGTQLELSLPGSTASVTLDGEAAGVTVDGNVASRILLLDTGVRATLDHLNLTHGRATGSGIAALGGAVSNAGTLTVSDSALTFNSAERGGGIYNTGNVTVSHSNLGSNAAFSGGGIYNNSAPATITDSTVGFNSANVGGAIENFYGTLTVERCVVSDNSAGAAAGIDSEGIPNTLVVTDSRIVRNRATGMGGGMNLSYGRVTISGSTLEGNLAGNGGGIDYAYGSLTITDSTLRDNDSTFGGGILAFGNLTVARSAITDNFAHYGGGIGTEDVGRTLELTLIDTTVSGNTASADGGGLWVVFTTPASTVSLANDTITDNRCNTSGRTYRGGGLSVSARAVVSATLHNTLIAGNFNGPSGSTPDDVRGDVNPSSSYNLLGDGDGMAGLEDGVNHNQIGTAAGPIDPRLAPLGSYGGPTPTFALLPDSPARAAGDPAAGGTDQRGLPRPAGGPTDIGAFQSQADPFLVTTLADPGQLSGLLSLREAVNLANVLPGNHTVSFSDDLDGGVVRLTHGELELSAASGLTTIDGRGRFALSGENRSRILEVDPGATAAVRGLGLLNGNAGSGAGVFNRGTLTVAGCVLYGNTAYNGGAILNQGRLILSGSTLGFNVATLGAGIDNEGELTAYNSTLLYNAALRAGGALRNEPTGSATLTSLTVSRNSANEGGGLDVAGGLVLLHNSIVAGNYSAYARFASDIVGRVDAASRYNLIGTGGSGGLSDGENHNHVGVADPGLTTPEFSGPETPAFGFTEDSPALGAGDPDLLNDPVLRLDQHGNVRTSVNIGAV